MTYSTSGMSSPLAATSVAIYKTKYPSNSEPNRKILFKNHIEKQENSSLPIS
jgi:hypothetical protein